MDPNEALRMFREAMHVIHVETDTARIGRAVDQALDVMEALDGWLTKGGFLPAAWDHSTEG
jgi:alkyl hydroperoxide reductase subunit AhpC